jgi:hypothetical protein
MSTVPPTAQVGYPSSCSGPSGACRVLPKGFMWGPVAALSGVESNEISPLSRVKEDRATQLPSGLSLNSGGLSRSCALSFHE